VEKVEPFVFAVPAFGQVQGAAGAGLLVCMSVLRAGSTQLAIAPGHKATEQAITQSNVPFTFLRNSFCTENYTARIPSCLARGAIVGAAGGALISAASRAGYAAACITAPTPDSHQNAASELAGPPFTMHDVAGAVWRATGIRLEDRNLSPGDGGTCSSLPAAESRNLRDGISRRPARGSR